MVGPVLVVAASAAVLGCLAVRDPNEPGLYPLCPFRALTGWDCPGCGTLRALHALTQGDLARAADHNVLLLAVLPFLAWRLVRWTRTRWSGATRPSGLAPPLVLYALLVVIVVFWVVRNLPGVPFLSSVVG
jgi:hypothetical protein